MFPILNWVLAETASALTNHLSALAAPAFFQRKICAGLLLVPCTFISPIFVVNVVGVMVILVAFIVISPLASMSIPPALASIFIACASVPAELNTSCCVPPPAAASVRFAPAPVTVKLEAVVPSIDMPVPSTVTPVPPFISTPPADDVNAIAPEEVPAVFSNTIV